MEPENENDGHDLRAVALIIERMDDLERKFAEQYPPKDWWNPRGSMLKEQLEPRVSLQDRADSISDEELRALDDRQLVFACRQFESGLWGGRPSRAKVEQLMNALLTIMGVQLPESEDDEVGDTE